MDPVALRRSHEAPVFKTGHHVGIDAVGVGVNIEGLLAARDGILAEVGLKCRLHVILEIGVVVLGAA